MISTWICCSDSWKLESISLMTETMKCIIHLVSSSRVLYLLPTGRVVLWTMVFSCRSPLDLSYPVMINYEDTSYMEHGIWWCFVVSENSCYNLKSILSSPANKRCTGRHWQDVAVSGVSLLHAHHGHRHHVPLLEEPVNCPWYRLQSRWQPTAGWCWWVVRGRR